MRRNGFTLLEVILAATMTAFVALVAVAGLRAVTTTRTTVDQASAAADALRYVTEKIQRDLASAVRGSGVIFEGMPEDTALELPLSLRIHVVQTDRARRDGIESDLYEVEYALLRSDEKSYFVRRVCPIVGAETDREETDGGILTVLSESIVDFQIQYYDGTEWLDEWVNYTELPQLVMIHLAAADISDLASDSEEAAGRRILQRTIWMHFPGEPKLGDAADQTDQTTQTDLQSITAGTEQTQSSGQ